MEENVQQLDAERAQGFRTGRPGLAPGDVAAGADKPLHSGSLGHWAPQPGRDGGARDGGGSSPWLRDGGLKVFLDGSLGGRTAYLREPYLDAPAARADADATQDHAGHDHGDAGATVGPRGSRIWTDEQLDHHVGVAHAAGIQVHAHAIGDGAIDQGLAAFERLAAREDLEGHGWAAARFDQTGAALAASSEGAERGGPRGTARRSDAADAQQGTSLRHRFEHFEIVHDDQLGRAAALGIVSSSQPNFVGEWSAKGGMYEARLGARYRLNNRFVTFKQVGLPLAFGSDGMPFGPLVGLESAVRHPDPTQRLSPEEAIWHYTYAAAWALHWEAEIGHLASGCKADLVVLQTKDLSRPPTAWEIEATIAGGEVRSGRLA